MINSHIRKRCFRNHKIFIIYVGIYHLRFCFPDTCLRPNFQPDRERCVSDPSNFAIAADYIAYPDRLDEFHGIHRNRNCTTTCYFDCHHATGYIHLGHDPSTKDIPIRICVTRHGGGTEKQFSLRMFDLFCQLSLLVFQSVFCLAVALISRIRFILPLDCICGTPLVRIFRCGIKIRN